MSVDRLREVLDAVAGDDTRLTPRDLSEMLWLACHLPAPEPPAVPPLPATPNEAPPEQPPPLRPPQTEPSEPPTAPAPAAEQHALHTPLPAPQEEPGGDGKDVFVPTAPMLRHPLALQRALRPLKRRVPSPRHRVINEDATAARIADHPSNWVPVMDPARERWLSLALVVDSAPSMRIWRPLIRELRDLLIRLGAFRDVRVWHLGRTGVRPYPGGPLSPPAALVDPTGRRAVLVVSDCSGPNWWNGHVGPALHLWAAHGPTAILQPLVERLWRRSAAPVVPGLATSPHPGAPNTALSFVPYGGGRPPKHAVPIPVLEIRPEWLADWAQLVTASGSAGRPTAITYVTREPRPAAAPPRRERELPIEERVARFYAAASPTAAELAAHVAVSVPALPVMRLIQQRLVPASRPGDLAEVMLSGLLQPVDAERGVYDFVPGAREALLATLPRPESLATAEVLAEVSAEISSRMGSTAEVFRAVMPAADGTRALADRPFALVSPEALRFLNHTAIPVRTSPAEPATAPASEVTRKTTRTASAWPLFAIGADDLRIWDPSTNETVARWKSAGPVHALTTLPEKPLLISGHADLALCVTELTAERRTLRFALQDTDRVSALTTFRDIAGHDVIASGGSDGVVRFWSASTGAQVRTGFHAHTQAIRAMTAFPGPDGRPRLATGGDDGIVQVWDPDSDASAGTLLPNQGPPGNAVLALATFTGPGQRTILAAGHRDGAIRLWYDFGGSQARAPLTRGKGAVTAIAALTAHGRPLLASARGSGVQLWDPLERRPLGPPLTGHRDMVLAIVAFTGPDGRPLIASMDGFSLRIWDPITGTPAGPVLESRGLRALAVLPSMTIGDRTAVPGPSTSLLRPERRVVPFRGREHELAELIGWCQSPAERSSAKITGRRGTGKTRLAVELAARMRAEGWNVRHVTDGTNTVTGDTNGPLLTIVELDGLPADVSDLDRFGPEDPERARLLLVSESAQPGRADVNAHDRVIHLSDLKRTPEVREAAFDGAMTAFCIALGLPRPREIVRPDLSSRAYGRVLTVHLAALKAALATGPTRSELDRERDFWRFGCPEPIAPRLLDKVVALGVLWRSAHDDHMVAMLRRLPGLTRSHQAIAHWLSCAYPPGGELPQRIVNALLADIVQADPEFLKWNAEQSANDPVARMHMLSVLDRAVQDPEISEALSQAAPGRPEPDAGHARPQLTELITRRRPRSERLESPIGVDARGEPVWLDVSQHGLAVGGERGELVRTLVRGLAALYNANDFAVLTADGHGGTSFPGLDGLPHVAAAPVTPLPSEADRSISRLHDALLGELVQRQEDTVPRSHLLIVLENFTELTNRKPEFTDLILELLRADRDLRIHVLLTSHHASARALRLLEGRLSYRVEIPISSGGRGLLQVADEPPVPFVLAEGKPVPQRSVPVRQILLSPLREPPILDDLLPRSFPSQGTPHAVIGVVDRPLHHRQDPLTFDLQGPRGNVAIVGSTGSGKSTLLVTFVRSLTLTNTEHSVRFILFDQLAGLAPLPQVRSIGPDDPGRSILWIREIDRHLAQNDTDGASRIVLVVDEWAELVRSLAPEAVQALHHIVEHGWRSGVHVVASATGWSQFDPDVRDRFGTRLELALDSPADSLIDPGLAAEVPPGSPGRGITQAAEHFYAALPPSPADDRR
ncbi:SAV_2336 N-terminal domain-related protein [Actinomadura fulvescens]|uniref:FtsK domain-containing protein n=1 Tax=Actinomadura fulvescens TaxID=46160 RepID=A0ABP6D0H7_9ACTN